MNSHNADPTLPHIAVHLHSQSCLSCGHTARWSKVYESITQGNTLRRLMPARSRAAWPTDYEIIATSMPIEYVPICFSCIDAAKVEPDHEAHKRWQETLMRKREEAKAQSAAPAPKATAPTIDML